MSFAAFAEHVGDFLHGEGIGRCARSDPQKVKVIFEGGFDVASVGDFGCDFQAGLLTNFVEPCEAGDADTFETSGFVRGFQIPARYIFTPNAKSSRAVCMTCSSVSGAAWA